MQLEYKVRFVLYILFHAQWKVFTSKDIVDSTRKAKKKVWDHRKLTDNNTYIMKDIP